MSWNDIPKTDIAPLQNIHKSAKYIGKVNNLKNTILTSILTNWNSSAPVYTYMSRHPYKPFLTDGDLYEIDADKINKIMGGNKIPSDWEIMGVCGFKTDKTNGHDYQYLYWFFFWPTIEEFLKEEI